MNIKLITKDDRNTLMNGLVLCFNNKIDKLKVTGIAPRELFDCLELLGAEVDEDSLETNGWQCDYWTTFAYNNNRYMIYGCAFDGTADITRE